MRRKGRMWKAWAYDNGGREAPSCVGSKLAILRQMNGMVSVPLPIIRITITETQSASPRGRATTRRKTNVSDRHLKGAPHRLRDREDAWWYEESRGMTVVVEFYGAPTQTVLIPWKEVRAALARLDRKGVKK